MKVNICPFLCCGRFKDDKLSEIVNVIKSSRILNCEQHKNIFLSFQRIIKMSVEEEVELRDMVAQTLELNGCLPKLRAQLRANLFLALDEDSKLSKQTPLLNTKVKSCLEAPEGQLMFCLVREFLEYFDLDSTMSVYDPESYVGSYYKYEGRQKIMEDLGLKSMEDNITGPILLHLVKIAQMKSKTLKINLTNIKGESNGSSTLSSIHNEVNGEVSGTEENNSGHKNSFNVSEELALPLNVTHVIKNRIENDLDSTYVKKDAENDDTFNGTSSLEEEVENAVDEKLTINEQKSSEADSSPDTKSKSDDKSKTAMKCDKLKTKLDLPPLQLNKSRGSDLLPSFYTKEFREKSSRDFDFEIKDDYEEDFMSGSEIELSGSKIESPKPLFEELQQEKNKMKSISNSKDNTATNLSVDSEIGTVSEASNT